LSYVPVFGAGILASRPRDASACSPNPRDSLDTTLRPSTPCLWAQKPHG